MMGMKFGDIQETHCMADVNPSFEIIKILISSGIATVAAYGLNTMSSRKQEEKRYCDELSKIIQISIQYPELEDETFTSQYPGSYSSRKDYLRYESYCILIFNLLEQVTEFYSFQPEYVVKFVHVEEWVNLHKGWWQDPQDSFKNQQGYSPQFIDFINSYIN